MSTTTAIRRDIKLHINAENMLTMVESENLTELADVIGRQGWDHADSKVEDAAASINFYLEGLRNALTTIVESR